MFDKNKLSAVIALTILATRSRYTPMVVSCRLPVRSLQSVTLSTRTETS